MNDPSVGSLDAAAFPDVALVHEPDCPRRQTGWVKNLLLFFDGVALVVRDSMREQLLLTALTERHREDYRLIVLLLAYTGIRFGELAALRVGRLDFTRRRAVIAESVTLVGAKQVFGTPMTPRSTKTYRPTSTTRSGRDRDEHR